MGQPAQNWFVVDNIDGGLSIFYNIDQSTPSIFYNIDGVDNVNNINLWLIQVFNIDSRRADRAAPSDARLCDCHFVDKKKENGPSIFEWNKKKRFAFSSPQMRKRWGIWGFKSYEMWAWGGGTVV